MKAYSQDLREKVLRAVDQGKPRREIVNMFDVSLATLQEICPVASGSDRPTASTPRCDPGRALPPVGGGLWHAGEYKHHEPCHPPCGLDARKKTLGASERNEEERAAWRAEVSPLPANQLVFVDECGSNIALTPLSARAPKGERAKGSVPRNRGKNTTLIASLSLEGMGAAMILEGSTNTTAFELYIEQILAPTSQAGQIVIMDNLQAHKSARVRTAIEAKGCQLLFLPGYSPDLSPIEEAFSKLKTALRRAGARTREALEEAIAQALLTITAQDAQGWFQHCGYLLTHERKS